MHIHIYSIIYSYIYIHTYPSLAIKVFLTRMKQLGTVSWCILDSQTLQWRHNGRDGVLNRRRLKCLLNCLLRRCRRKHESSASLAFVRGIHRSPVNSPHKGPVTQIFFHLMTSSWIWYFFLQPLLVVMAVTVAALSSVLTPTFLLIFLTTFLLAVVIHHNWRSSQFPPGPISFPIIGSLLSLAGGDIRSVGLWDLRDIVEHEQHMKCH